MPIETLASLMLDSGRPLVVELRSDSINNPNTSLDRVILALQDGQGTWSGSQVSPETALNVSAVYGCVRILSNVLAMVDLPTKRRQGGSWVDAENHYLWKLLMRQSAPGWTAFRFKRIMQSWVLLYGNAYAEVTVSGNGTITALKPIHPKRVRRIAEDAYAVQDFDQYGAGKERPVHENRMFHLRNMEIDGSGDGMSVIKCARQSIGSAMATEKFGAKFFENGAKMGGILEIPGGMKPEATAKLMAAIEGRHRGSENANRILAVDAGSKFTQTSIPPEDAQFLETRQFQVVDICRWFGLSPHMLGDLQGGKNMDVEQLALEFVKFGAGPHLDNWECEVNNSLLSETEGRSVKVQFDRDELTEGNFLSRAQGLCMVRQNGGLTGNELREELGYNPSDQDGMDKFLANSTMQPVGALNGSQQKDTGVT